MYRRTVVRLFTSDVMTARIFKIERLSTYDGPGFRTVVFFKGCPLACAWCHNPESISSRKDVWHIKNKCINCRKCEAVCPNYAITFDNSEWNINREKCDGCFKCVDSCPSGAIEPLGTEYTIEELYNEIIDDKTFWDSSGGGVTFSGGEPTVYHDFIIGLSQRLKGKEVNIALDTSLQCTQETLSGLLPYMDFVLADIKSMNNKMHKKLTGVDNFRIKENFVFISKKDNYAGDIWIRTPLVPGFNDSVSDLKEIYHFMNNELEGNIEKWELLFFNPACEDKYEKLEKDWKYKEHKLTAEFKKKLEKYISGLKVETRIYGI